MRDYADQLERRLLAVSSSLAERPAAPSRQQLQPRRLAMSFGAAVAAALVGVFCLAASSPVTRRARGERQLVSFADASPLVLLDQAGWRIDYVNEDSGPGRRAALHNRSGARANPSVEDNTTDAQLSWFPGRRHPH